MYFCSLLYVPTYTSCHHVCNTRSFFLNCMLLLVLQSAVCYETETETELETETETEAQLSFAFSSTRYMYRYVYFLLLYIKNKHELELVTLFLVFALNTPVHYETETHLSFACWYITTKVNNQGSRVRIKHSPKMRTDATYSRDVTPSGVTIPTLRFVTVTRICIFSSILDVLYSFT